MGKLSFFSSTKSTKTEKAGQLSVICDPIIYSQLQRTLQQKVQLSSTGVQGYELKQAEKEWAYALLDLVENTPVNYVDVLVPLLEEAFPSLYKSQKSKKRKFYYEEMARMMLDDALHQHVRKEVDSNQQIITKDMFTANGNKIISASTRALQSEGEELRKDLMEKQRKASQRTLVKRELTSKCA